MVGRIFAVGAAILSALTAPSLAASNLAEQTNPAEDAAITETQVERAGPVVEAPPPLIPIAAFADNSQFQNALLSPDGSTIAVQLELEGAPYVLLLDADTRKAKSKLNLGGKVDLEWFRWVTDEKIIFSVSNLAKFFGEETRFTRLYLIDIKANSHQFIGRKADIVSGDDVIHIADDGSYLLMEMQRTPYDYPSVYRFELKEDGEITEVQREKEGVWNWYADDDGTVRMGTGWVRKKLRVYYRENAEAKLRLVGKIGEDDKEQRFWDVAQIVSGSDQGYVLEEGENGRTGVRLFDYAKGEVVETFYENPDWDVETLLLEDGKPQAAFYTDDRDRVVWFDEAMGKTYRSLRKALKADEIWVTSRSKDHSRMLVWAGSEADPGVLYVYTPAEKRINQFAEMRPKVNFSQLARPKAVSYAARDGTKISGYLTLPRGREAKNLPLILLPHGGPYGVRDKLQYDDDVQLLANRGYAVLQPNFRGSAGYGEDFTKLGNGEIGRKMQDDIDDAMDWAVSENIADADRVCVVGGSYGGYAALWAVVRNPERYRCAASWAGVTDWDMMLKYDKRFFTRKGNKKWRARIEGDDDFDLDTVSPYRLGRSLKRPVLLAHGTDDNRVPFRQFKKMRSATKKAEVQPELLIIKDEGHSFSTPDNKRQWYEALIAFLEKHNPAD